MRSRVHAVAPVALLALLAVVLIGSAWQSDDAWITFRTVDNLWHGYGLRWNPVERVQAYTHPLWMLVAVVCYGVTREVYFSTLALSLALSLLTAWLLFRRAASPGSGLLALALVVASKASGDYEVCGLETPLLALLLVLFVDEARTRERRPGVLGLLAGLVALTRLDALLLVAPAAAFLVWTSGERRRAATRFVVALAPLLVWEAFSLVYYGFLFPNTAYAKLHVDVGLVDLVVHGARYFGDSLVHDPVTLLAVGLALRTAARHGDARDGALGVGVALYLLYILRIGGDFMSGRFFVAPFFASLRLLERASWTSPERTWRLGIAPLVGLIGLRAYGLVATVVLAPRELTTVGRYYASSTPEPIADERAYYYPYTGLLPVLRRTSELRAEGLPTPPYPSALIGAAVAARVERGEPLAALPYADYFDPEGAGIVALFEGNRVSGQIGFLGYFVGPQFSVIDKMALADPLLARLPFAPSGEWRVGHYARRVPDGYAAALVASDDLLVDRNVAAYDAKLRQVTRGPLFSAERWRAIVEVNLGRYDALLQRDYR